MFDHYLGWLTNGGSPADHFQFLQGDDYPYIRQWGMATALEDARAVVLQARGRGKGRRSVVLGGHSLGASLTAAYASWDFNGTPGYQDIEGMVLIDGGLMGSFDAFTASEAQTALTNLENGSPFLDLLGAGIPEIAGIFGEIGGIFALRAPTESATTLQSFPLLPAAFNPPVTVTNRALLGYAFDRDTSPDDLSLLHINAGRPGAGRRPARLGRRRGHPGRSAWRRPSARSRPTRSSGTSREGSRSTPTAPTSWSRTTSRTCSACACSTSRRSTSPSTRCRPT